MQQYSIYNKKSFTLSICGQSLPGLSSTSFSPFVRPSVLAGSTLGDLVGYVVTDAVTIRYQGVDLSFSDAVAVCNAAVEGMREPLFVSHVEASSVTVSDVPTGAPTHQLGLDVDGNLVKGAPSASTAVVYTGEVAISDSSIAGSSHHVYDVTVSGARVGDCCFASVTSGLFSNTLAAGQRVTLNACVMADGLVRVDVNPAITLNVPAGSKVLVVVVP